MKNFTMRQSRIWLARGAVLCLACLLAACSMVRLGYNHGEQLTYWWMNSYVDFETDQQPWVRQEIEQFFTWHRKTQLKDYSQLLTRAQNQLSRTVTAADALVYYDELKKRAFVIIEQALPSLANLTLSLTPQQIANIEKKFASNNEEYRKDHLHRDIDRRQKYRYKKIMQQAEYWFGDFSHEQEVLIRQASNARPLNNELWMEERLRRQRDMIAMLKKIQAEKPSREVVIEMLRKHAQSVFERHENAEKQAFFDSSRESAAQLAAYIISIATHEQKARAVRNLQKWIDNFAILAAQGA